MKLCSKANFSLIFSLSILLLMVSVAGAQDMQAIKAKMLNRKPTIDALKNQGAIGEGVDGYLHVRQNKGNAQQVVNQENADRRAVNGIIAKKEGAPLEKVSRTVGAKLVQGSKPGHWIKKGDGSWSQK